MTGKRSFPTRTGYCHLYADRIEIEINGFTGRLRSWLSGKRLASMWLYYLALSVLFLLSALLALTIENYFLAAFLGVFAVISLVALWIYRRHTFSVNILRDQIDRVEYSPAVEGQSRASFQVYYQPGRYMMQRPILLPGKSQNGASVAQSAYWMMKEEGLLAEEATS